MTSKLATAVCVIFAAVSASAQERASPDAMSLDSLLNTRVTAASRYAQMAGDAPASVTVLTTDDLRSHGYRTLLEALEDVRGFYVTSDRNYGYLGTRGFSRPTDYNNRILFLIDGHAVNEQIWGGAPIGSEFPVNLDAIERIEVVRGPGSALFGSSAMFAVINVVTKTGIQLDGSILTVRAGSAGLREAGLVGGHDIGTRGSFAVSGLVSRSEGRDLYFPEFDDPATNDGVAVAADWERGGSLLGSLSWDATHLRVGYRSRSKGIPTGAFEARFNDPRAQTTDETMWVDLTATREVNATLQLSARAYADRYRYRGVYPDEREPPYTDAAMSTSVGVEGIAVWDFTSNNRLTLGTELRRASQAEYVERFGNGTVSRDNAPFGRVSIYGEDHWQLSTRTAVVVGIRVDGQAANRTAAAPRLAVVHSPDPATTVKLLYGQAFRSPSVAEADLTTSYYAENRALRAERIHTFEANLHRRFGTVLLLSGSLYHYRVSGLIEQTVDSVSATFHNLSRSRATGIEAQLDVAGNRPVAGRFSYQWQRAEDGDTGEHLTNSPERVALVSMVLRTAFGLRGAINARYESDRRTLAGSTTGSFTRTDANVAYGRFERSPAWLRGSELSLRVTNLFAVRYSHPAGGEHLQVSIPQDTRSVSVQLTRRF